MTAILSRPLWVNNSQWPGDVICQTEIKFIRYPIQQNYLRQFIKTVSHLLMDTSGWKQYKTIFACSGIAQHRGFASLTHSKSQSRIVVTSAAAHGRIVKTVKKVTTYMVGTVKRQNTSSSEHSWRKIAETRQSLFRKSAWSGYAHKMCAVDSNTKRLYSNEMSDRATHFTVFMIMNCPVEQQILAAYGSIVDSRLLLTLLERHIKTHKST